MTVAETLLAELRRRALAIDTPDAKALAELAEQLVGLLQEQIMRCPLTHCYNEYYFGDFLSSELAGMGPDSEGGAIFLIAIDNLGSINDRFGEMVGNEALVACSYALQAGLPPEATLFRLQASTFAAYLPDRDPASALDCAEEARRTVEESRMFLETLTVSIAVIGIHEVLKGKTTNTDLPGLIMKAGRQRLREARRAGMNKVVSRDGEGQDSDDRPLVLMADTDPVTFEILGLAIEGLGCRVESCVDGEALWAKIEGSKVGMVISELFLPRLDAFAVRSKMLGQSRSKDIPYMILSRRKDDETVQKGSELKIEYYLKKPVFVNEVVGIVGMRLARR
ncbi:MAG: diguanylate cyclase [Spirochaetota bacterium]